MDNKRRRDILDWMLSQTYDSKWWLPGSLTLEGNPAGNPPGNLNGAEAQSIFHDLLSKNLLIPTFNQHGQKCYILNECKEKEWRTEIREVNRPWLFKSQTLKSILKGAVWIITAYLGGYLGALGKQLTDKPSSRVGIVTPAKSAERK
jgi:hypothetical protein